MSDTNTNPFPGVTDLADYNEVGPDGNPGNEKPNAPKPGDGKPLEDPQLDWSFNDERSGDSVEDPDCSIDDAQKAQFQAKYGDEMYYQPFTPKPPRGSLEDIQHRLRITGLRLRK